MDERKLEKIEIMSTLLTVLVEGKEAEVEGIKKVLWHYQDQCPHERAEVYREHKIGPCSRCKSKLLTKTQIDEFYST